MSKLFGKWRTIHEGMMSLGPKPGLHATLWTTITGPKPRRPHTVAVWNGTSYLAFVGDYSSKQRAMQEAELALLRYTLGAE